MRKLALIVALLFAQAAHAGPLAELFADGVFGLPWGSSLDDVKTAFPDGKSDNQSSIPRYAVKDDRPLFNIERTPKNEITFVFDAHGDMHGVGIEFPAKGAEVFTVLLNTLTTYFGPHENVPNDLGTVAVKWPMDEGVTLSLIHLPGVFSSGDVLVSIGYTAQQRDTPTKESLGF